MAFVKRPPEDQPAASTGADEERLVAATRPPNDTPATRVDEPSALLSGVVFSSPHSGRVYFPEFVEASRLTAHALRASEDAFIDDLFRQAVDFGAPLISATAPRAFIDVNRAPGDLDPALIDGAEPRPANARVIAGLGVVPRIVAEGVPIYDRRISLADAQRRIARWHAPYHRRLSDLLIRARRRFGSAFLVDCHSMPSVAMGPTRRGASTADVVLGDRFGASCDPGIVDRAEASFVRAGFRVARNAPFAGGYITERYGRPAAGVSALQIEIDRAIYLDQSSVAPSEGFEALRRALTPVIAEVCAIIAEPEVSVAAE